MGKVIRVADVKWFAHSPAQNDDPREIAQRDREHQQRRDHRPRARVEFAVEVRQNGQHGEQIADEMAAGVAEKRAGVGKIVRQKTHQRAAGKKGDERDQILAVHRGDHGEADRADRAEAGAKAVHVVHEVEGVDDGEQPENRDGIAEQHARHEQRDADARSGDERCDKQLAGEFVERAEFVFVVQPAENRHGDGAEENGGEFEARVCPGRKCVGAVRRI